MDYLKLSFTGFLQVFFVAINTVFISKELIFGVFTASFTISFIWSYNVKKIVFGNMLDRVFYSLGASLGGVIGMLTANFIFKNLVWNLF